MIQNLKYEKIKNYYEFHRETLEFDIHIFT